MKILGILKDAEGGRTMNADGSEGVADTVDSEGLGVVGTIDENNCAAVLVVSL